MRLLSYPYIPSPIAWLLRTKSLTLAIETSKRRIRGHWKIAMILQVKFLKEIRLYHNNSTGSYNKTTYFFPKSEL